MQNRMRTLGLLIVAVACSGPAKTEPRPTALAPAPPSAPVGDACGADAATLQPALDAHQALFERWGFPPEAAEKVRDARPGGLPGTIKSRLQSLGASDLVLAIGTTLWPGIVRLLNELPTGLRIHLAFEVPSPAASDPAAVQQLRDGGSAAFRELGRDMTQRCPRSASCSWRMTSSERSPAMPRLRAARAIAKCRRPSCQPCMTR